MSGRSLAQKRLIFTVTAGRSGTSYLAKLLALVPEVASFHEPAPHFVDVMRAVQSKPDQAYRFWIERKLPKIARVPEPIYIETSHLFCKGFAEPLLDLGIVPDLIILRRSHRKIALSLYQLGVIPGRTEEGLRFLLSPADPGVLPLQGWHSLHDYQLCYWYCLEIERRMRIYTKLFSCAGANVVQISLEELVRLRGITRLLRELELPWFKLFGWIQCLKTVRRRENTKQSKKRGIDVGQEEIAILESQVHNITHFTTSEGEFI